MLLILAGVAIGQLTGNGLFENAKKAKIQQMRAEAKENIDLAIMQIQISESGKGNSVNLKTLHGQLPTVDDRIEAGEYTDGDNTLNVIYSDKGMSFEVTVDSSFNIVVAETPIDGNSKFNITVDEITTTGLRVTGNESDLSKIDYSEFTYVAQTSNSNPIKVEHITETSYTFTGLEQGTTYTVYMIAIDNAGNEKKSSKKTVTTEKIPDGTETGAITFSDATWTSGKASVTISTNKAQYYIEYQINSTTGTWTKAQTPGTEVTLNNLNHNDIVYARLTDGTVSGNYANITIADTEGPKAFTIKVSNTSETSIKISGNTTDTASGLKDYSYYVKTSDGTVVNKKEHTTDTSYEVTGLTTGTEYTVYMIAYDNAGNETKSSEKTITVQKPIAYATSGVVEYDAGKWTQPEIDALGSLYNYNSSHSVSSALNFTFGGFKSGDSRNSSVAPQEGWGTPTYEGWQVLEMEEKNGKKYIKSIVHAGAPENFVYGYTATKDEYRAEYILSNGTTKNSSLTSNIPSKTRNWDLYKDQSKLNLIDSVHCMTIADADKLPNDTARKTGAYYWLGSALYDGYLWYVNYNGSTNTYYSYCLGVRPVVSLKSGVYVVSGDGTGDDPFILGIEN